MQDEDDDVEGEPMVVRVFNNGKVAYPPPKLSQIREKAQNGLATLPAKYKRLTDPQPAPVRLSAKLQRLSESLWRNPEQ